MPIQLNEENGGKLLILHISGKLVKADYGTLCLSSSDSSGNTENCACCST